MILAAALAVLCFFGCAAAPDEKDNAVGLEKFANARLGVVTGSLYGGYSKQQFPNAQISEFNNFADVLLALKLGKIDGTMLDLPNFNSVKRTEKSRIRNRARLFGGDRFRLPKRRRGQ